MTHKLIQAYTDEANDEGLLIAIDFEKAFDRVSWTYLKNATKALGFGPKFADIILLTIKEAVPPLRRVKMNGSLGVEFPLQSRVAQGNPISPLLFFVVREAVTRMIAEDSCLQGIKIGQKEHRISQLADDILFILKGYKQLPRIWSIIEQYNNAAAMKTNVNKTECIRCGNHKYCDIPRDTYSNEIQWKRRIAKWKTLASLSIFGRARLVNLMIYSRFGYPAQCMLIPKEILDYLEEDVQSLKWGRDPSLDEDKLGSSKHGN
eukprot:487228-Pleurochrysis_carterae.AAC.1